MFFNIDFIIFKPCNVMLAFKGNLEKCDQAKIQSQSNSVLIISQPTICKILKNGIKWCLEQHGRNPNDLDKSSLYAKDVLECLQSLS